MQLLHQWMRQVEDLGVRIRKEARKGNIVVDVCYRTPSEIEEVDDVFFKQLEEMLLSQALEVNKI